jgi:FkbM family methyltransferase
MKAFTPERSAAEVEFILDNEHRYDQAASLFDDRESRFLMKELLAFRALGPERVRLSTNTPRYWAAYAAAASWRRPEPTRKVFPPYLVEHFRGLYHGCEIDLDCWLGSIVFTYLLRQYVFTRPETLEIAVSPGDRVIDAGVCFGDTALGFAATAGPGGRVFGFEPASDQIEIARENLSRNPLLADRISLVDRALSQTSNELVRFKGAGAGGNINPVGDLEVRTLTIDDFVKAEGVAKIDFIKMDVEGAEGAALEGAARTIRDMAPTLAISAYHRKSDLFELPTQIRRLNPAYRLFLDHYTIHSEETVIFAVAA